MLLWFEFRGLPKRLQRPKRILLRLFKLLLSLFGPFGGSEIAPRSPLGNRPKRANNEPQEAPRPKMNPKRSKEAPKKGTQKVPTNEPQDS